MPICLPKNKRFPDSTGLVYVAGWGLHHEFQNGYENCKTGEHGPNPFSQCKFPFKTPSSSFSSFGCIYGRSPTAKNKICMKLHRKMKKMNKKKLLENGYGRGSENTSTFLSFFRLLFIDLGNFS